MERDAQGIVEIRLGSHFSAICLYQASQIGTSEMTALKIFLCIILDLSRQLCFLIHVATWLRWLQYPNKIDLS